LASTVILDAMIKRADFAIESEPQPYEMSDKIKLEEIAGSNQFTKLLRKPDFQRETNHWSPHQIAGLIKSFASGELIPSLILWKSNVSIFVIDGGHRLSAIRAWVENDYGDGPISLAFYGPNFSTEQRRKASQTRALVEKEVGRYSDLKSLTEEQLAADPERAKIHSTIFTRSLIVQWIPGGREVAETSFFKINSKGTALDATEELLLKNRLTPYAIAARSIVRSGTGHKYWSQFAPEIQKSIEQKAAEIHDLWLKPDLQTDVKSLDLPIGGTTSPVESLKSLIEIFSYVDSEDDLRKGIEKLKADLTGESTIGVLDRTRKVINRMTGNHGSSLGLHPVVYFYTDKGKHSRFLFLGLLRLFAQKISQGNTDWFKRFSNVRQKVEEVLISKKEIINQSLGNVNSSTRIAKVSDLLNGMVTHFEGKDVIDDSEILMLMGLRGIAGSLQPTTYPTEFSTETKNAAFLRSALPGTPKCAVCGGFLHVASSVSYDHILPVSAGGNGISENIQLLHPFCNTGIKGGLVPKKP
jgi:hypothetical protein